MVESFESLASLLSALTSRRSYGSVDSLSGSHFEAAQYRGSDVILKYVCVDDDWIMRACGDLNCRQLTLLQSGLLERLPATIDTAVVAVAPYRSRHGHRGAAILMRDVAAAMVPPGNTPIDLASHLRFLEHMAMLHAAFWEWDGELELLPLAHHYLFLTPAMAAIEAGLGSTDPVPQAVAQGWGTLRELWPETAATLAALAGDPAPLLAALQATPQTLVHGDWKLGNLGTHPDGRTVLLDWDRCGRAPATVDLAWYLAVNCDRLPHRKEDAIAAYRASLEAHGVPTSPWWDAQLGAALIGAFLQLGWSKAGDAAELGWWNARLAEPQRLL